MPGLHSCCGHDLLDFSDTPFRIFYGRSPPTIQSYEAGESRVVTVAKTMAEQEELLLLVFVVLRVHRIGVPDSRNTSS
jgi:hypothetical protein